MKFINLIPIAVVVAMLFVVSCGKKPVMNNPSISNENSLSQTQTEPEVANTVPTPQAKVQLPKPDEQTSIMNQVILFGYDSDMLTPEAQSLLQHKAKWLQDNPSVAMRIDGHCDTRGTDAYNMALGDRRAEAVKNYLVDLGVDIRKLETQSYGEEKPAVQGDNEDAWAQNRRASFVMSQQ